MLMDTGGCEQPTERWKSLNSSCRSGVADQNSAGLAGKELPLVKGSHLRFVDRAGVEVKLVKILGYQKSGLSHTVTAAVHLAFGLLGAEQYQQDLSVVGQFWTPLHLKVAHFCMLINILYISCFIFHEIN